MPRLRHMVETLHHRGPDEVGLAVHGSVAMGMRRLSIIDLLGGQQPIYNEDQTVWTVFNDEIYNDCIKDEDGYWCSTQVDKYGEHYGSSGKWGICGPNCPGVPSGRITTNSTGKQHLQILMAFSYRRI